MMDVTTRIALCLEIQILETQIAWVDWVDIENWDKAQAQEDWLRDQIDTRLQKLRLKP